MTVKKGQAKETKPANTKNTAKPAAEKKAPAVKEKKAAKAEDVKTETPAAPAVETSQQITGSAEQTTGTELPSSVDLSAIQAVNKLAEDPADETSEPVISLGQALEMVAEAGYQVVKEEETAKPDNSPVVVIPYKKSAAAGEELKYALRAWHKYLPGCKIVIIGDAEDWFSSDVTLIEQPNAFGNAQQDVALKMIIAIASDDVPEDFIWSNDDIVPVTPLHMADIYLLRANGQLPKTKGTVTGTYAENKARTVAALEAAGLPTWDYSTHTPFWFNKTFLATVIEKFKADEEGYLISSLYFNYAWPEVRPVRITGGKDCFFTAQVYREDPPTDLLKEVFRTRKFVNYNDKGYKAVKKILEAKFPDKSKFEV